MRFSTTVEIEEPIRLITLKSKVALIGSCFAEKIGTRMRQSGMPALVNPFGVLYSPLSILQVLTQNPTFDSYYFEDADHRWHCWLTDSSFNSDSKEACKAAVLSARGRLFTYQPDTVIVTLGTNRYYAWKGTGDDCSDLVVGNCHKVPQTEFTEHKMKMEEITTVLESICQLFPNSHIVFTVSPFRYTKYGFHESQLCKSALLLGIEHVRKRHVDQVSYFPAYEIVLDELRDYRYYAEDLLHPSDQAIEYIWERFSKSYMDEETQCFLTDYEPIRRALLHRPSDPESPAYHRFLEETRRQQHELWTKYNLEF